MDESIKKLTERFTNFFTRSVAPSSIFFVLLYFNDRFFNDGNWFKEFLCFLEDVKSIHDIFLYILLVLFFLAYGYINQILSQLLDNLIKENYADSDEEYTTLRKKVVEKFTQKYNNWKDNAIIYLNDYNLYQILAKDKSIAPSNSYVDEAKNIHTFGIAMSFNFIIYGCIFYKCDELHGLGSILGIMIVLFLLHFVAKSRYKARNKRLYINYLLQEDKSEK